jgi:hypothetical protein
VTRITDTDATAEIVHQSGSSTADVSVIIPAYNREMLLAEAMGCVAGQETSRTVEVVVVDDGSTDDTTAVAIHCGARLSSVTIARQANAGPSAARNNGARLARGRYLSFLDSDDRITPTKIEKPARMLDSTPGADICVGLWGWWDERFAHRIALFGPKRSRQWPILPCFLRLEHFHSGCGLFRGDLVRNAKPWPEHMRSFEDHAWLIELALSGATTIFLPEEVYQLREHPGERASTQPAARAIATEDRYAAFLMNAPWPHGDRLLTNAVAERLLVSAQELWRAGAADRAEIVARAAFDHAASLPFRATLRAVWAARRIAGGNAAQYMTNRAIGIRSRVRARLPEAAWKASHLRDETS